MYLSILPIVKKKSPNSDSRSKFLINNIKNLKAKYSPTNEKKLIKKLIHKVYSCYN